MPTENGSSVAVVVPGQIRCERSVLEPFTYSLESELLGDEKVPRYRRLLVPLDGNLRPAVVSGDLGAVLRKAIL